MVLPPFYFKGMSDAGLYDYYAQLITGVNEQRRHLGRQQGLQQGQQ